MTSPAFLSPIGETSQSQDASTSSLMDEEKPTMPSDVTEVSTEKSDLQNSMSPPPETLPPPLPAYAGLQKSSTMNRLSGDSTVAFSPVSPYLTRDQNKADKFASFGTESVATLVDASDFPSGNSSGSPHSSSEANSLILEVPNTESDSNRPYSAKTARFQSFYGRHRRCILIFGIILLAIIAGGVTIYFLMPQIAQLFMNGAVVKFNSISIQNADAASFKTKVTGSISNAGPFNAETSPMLVSILYLGSVIGEMEMPSIQLQMGNADFEIESNFKIVNQVEYQSFLPTLLKSESFTWQLQGKTNLTALSFHFNELNFEKSVDIKGMNNFPGVQVKSFNLQGVEGQPIQTEITAELTNTSPISVEMGTLFFDLMFEQNRIGRVKAPNVTIQTGNNTLHLSGSLTKVASMMDAESNPFSNLFSNYMTNKESIVNCIGVGFEPLDPAKPVPWLAATVMSMNMTTVLPGSSVQMIDAFALEGLVMNFNTGRPMVADLHAQNLTVNFTMPFDFPIQIRQVKQNMAIHDKDNQLIGVATMDNFTLASNEMNPTQILTSLPLTQLRVVNETLFSHFVTDLFVSTTSTTNMQGSAYVIADTPVGSVLLSHIGFNRPIKLAGMQSLQYIYPDGRISNPIIRSYRVVKGLPEQIILETDITLYSPASLTAVMGDVILDLYMGSVRIGYSELKNLTVAPGDNKFVCMSHLAPRTIEERKLGDQLLSNSVNGVPTNLTMVGTMSSSSNPLVLESLSLIRLDAPFPGLPRSIVDSALLKINPFTAGITNEGKTLFRLRNDLNESVTIDRMNVNISNAGTPLAHLEVELSEPTKMVTILPGEQLKTPYYPIHFNKALSADALKALAQGVAGSLKVDAEGTIRAYVGQYEFTMQYKQDNLPTRISFL